jgi:hypothetical protein
VEFSDPISILPLAQAVGDRRAKVRSVCVIPLLGGTNTNKNAPHCCEAFGAENEKQTLPQQTSCASVYYSGKSSLLK